MTITILIPHYKTGMMTAYTIAQILKYKGDHDVKIVVIDNNAGDGSAEYLRPFLNEITYWCYPKDKLQSHGIAFDWAIPKIKTDWILTLESDSYPIKEGFLDYYEKIIEGDFDMGISLLTLSGGSYGHPAGSIYRTSLWHECKEYCDSMPYKYFPNMLMRDNFKAHLMVHESILNRFLENPDDWIELSPDYKPYYPKLAEEKCSHYSPVVGPFHNGMGGRQESIHNFGGRTWESDASFIIYNQKWQKIVGRMGYEPGQFLYYYAVAMGKQIFEVPTEVKWLPGKENRQQEYTLNKAGIKHIWAVSAYHEYTPEDEKDVAKIKQSIPVELYNTLPPNQRIK